MENSVLVVVDVQTDPNPGNLIPGGDKIPEAKDINIPPEWVNKGATAEDVIKGMIFARDVAIPNSIKVVKFFESKKLPIIYIRWGSFVQDVLDMEPTVRKYQSKL